MSLPIGPLPRRLVLLAALGLTLAAGPPAAARERPPAPGEVHQLTAKHGRSYALYVPSRYSRRSSWPLVISSHGRGGSGAGEMRAWQALANTHGFIVACPDMVTATHNRPPTTKLPPATEDDEVIMSIVEAVSGDFRVNRRAVMITGFSGGGNPSYHTGLRHPDVFTHICTRGGNYAPQHMPRDEAVLAAGREHLQIYIVFGDKDHELIIGPGGDDGQAHQARDALKAAGYAHVTFERVPNTGHKSMPNKAASWFGAYLEANAKRFKAGDKVDDLVAKAEEALGKGKVKKAVGRLLEARKAEDRAGLASIAQGHLDALEATGRERIAEAEALHASGDVKGARKLLSGIARDYKGLEVAAAAKALEKAWKP